MCRAGASCDSTICQQYEVIIISRTRDGTQDEWVAEGIEDGKRYIGRTDGWTMVGRTVSLDEEMTCNARDNRFQFPGAITISITKITNTYTI